jgi:hypothetical protein
MTTGTRGTSTKECTVLTPRVTEVLPPWRRPSLAPAPAGAPGTAKRQAAPR